MRNPRSILIAIEGIDGAGKTTQATMLRNALEAAGLDIVASREPTRGVHGQRIRESAATGRLTLEEELEAFAADRREHVETVIGPALDSGNIVILDRYYYSNMAYQGARGANVSAIRQNMESFAPVPDVVFLINTEPATGLFRIAHNRGDEPNEFENLDNLTAVYSVFQSFNDPNIVRIDGSPSAKSVHKAVMESFIPGALKAALCSKAYGCDDPFHCASRINGNCEWFNVQGTLTRSFEFA